MKLDEINIGGRTEIVSLRVSRRLIDIDKPDAFADLRSGSTVYRIVVPFIASKFWRAYRPREETETNTNCKGPQCSTEQGSYLS